MIIDLALLQEIVELKAREAQQLSCLVVRQGTRTVALNCELFEGFAARVCVLSYIVWQFHRDLHEFRISGGDDFL